MVPHGLHGRLLLHHLQPSWPPSSSSPSWPSHLLIRLVFAQELISLFACLLLAHAILHDENSHEVDDGLVILGLPLVDLTNQLPLVLGGPSLANNVRPCVLSFCLDCPYCSDLLILLWTKTSITSIWMDGWSGATLDALMPGLNNLRP